MSSPLVCKHSHIQKRTKSFKLMFNLMKLTTKKNCTFIYEYCRSGVACLWSREKWFIFWRFQNDVLLPLRRCRYNWSDHTAIEIVLFVDEIEERDTKRGLITPARMYILIPSTHHFVESWAREKKQSSLLEVFSSTWSCLPSFSDSYLAN